MGGFWSALEQRRRRHDLLRGYSSRSCAAVFPSCDARRWASWPPRGGSFDVFMVDAEAVEMVGTGLAFSRRAFPVLCPRSVAATGAPRLYLVFNAAKETIEFTLPVLPGYTRWTLLLETCTAVAGGRRIQVRLEAGGAAEIEYWRFRGRHDGSRAFGRARRRDLGRGSVCGDDPERNRCRQPVDVYDLWRGMMPPSIPVATYRLRQLTADFEFDDAAGARSLSEGRWNKSSVLFAIPQGARRQHARL